MSPTLTKATTLIASVVVTEALRHFVPAIATGLVAVAHALHPEAAKAEMEKRS